MTSRIDFMDYGDSLCLLSEICSGFRPVHMGLRYGDFYLTVPDGHVSSWRTAASADRVVAPLTTYSFAVDLSAGCPMTVGMLGEGHLVDSRWALFWKQWVHLGADMGLWKWKPRITSCVGTINLVLRACEIPVTATTAQGLYAQLTALEGRYGIRRIK